MSSSAIESYPDKVVNIKVIGVGGAGNNVVNRMIESGVSGVEFVVVNTDKQDLNKSKCPNKLQIGEKLTGGMGAGSKPEIGKKSAEESRAGISKILEGTDMVFITAGMGGGTGTGAAPIVADLAHEAGILTVGVVTKPFKFEGANRMRQAEAGIASLSEKVDSLIIIPNDRLKYVTEQKITFANAFGIADDVLKQAVTSISELVGYSERRRVRRHEGRRPGPYGRGHCLRPGEGRAGCHDGCGQPPAGDLHQRRDGRSGQCHRLSGADPGRCGDGGQHCAGGGQPRRQHHLRRHVFR